MTGNNSNKNLYSISYFPGTALNALQIFIHSILKKFTRVILMPILQIRKVKYIVKKCVTINWHNPKSFKCLIQITEEMPLPIYQKVKRKRNDNWWRWAPRTFIPQLVEVFTGTPCWKTTWEYLILNMCTACNSAIPLIKNIFICAQRHLQEYS